MTLGIFIVLAGYLIVSIIQSKNQPPATTSNNPGPSFRFDQSVAPGWWSDGAIHQNASDFTGGQVTQDNLASSLITINQGERGKPANCFVTYYYWNKPVDPAVALSAMEKQSVEGAPTVSLDPLRTQPIALNTPEGKKEYQIHQYEFTGSGSETRAKGVQFGYLPLGNAHIEVRGYCNEAAQLSSTSAALPAVSLTAK